MTRPNTIILIELPPLKYPSSFFPVKYYIKSYTLTSQSEDLDDWNETDWSSRRSLSKIVKILSLVQDFAKSLVFEVWRLNRLTLTLVFRSKYIENNGLFIINTDYFNSVNVWDLRNSLVYIHRNCTEICFHFASKMTYAAW